MPDLMITRFLSSVGRSLSKSWVWVSLVGLSLVGVATSARAATYNFYFNNTEQGANSTANPTVVVKEDPNGVAKVVTPEPSPSPSEAPSTVELKPEPTVAAEPSGVQTARTYPRGRELTEFDNSLWRFQLGFSSVSATQDRKRKSSPFEYTSSYSAYNSSRGYGSSYESNSVNDRSGGVSLSLSRGLSRDITLTGTVLWEGDTVRGRQFMVEGQWMPIGADIFWQERGWQFGALGGVSTFRDGKSGVSPYVGLKTDFFIAPTIFATLSARRGSGFSQTELGVGVRI
jgi:hypothetical protein